MSLPRKRGSLGINLAGQWARSDYHGRYGERLEQFVVEKLMDVDKQATSLRQCRVDDGNTLNAQNKGTRDY